MNSTNRHHWTPEELELLRREYADTSTAALAKRLGVSRPKVYAKASSLGLLKSDAYLASKEACRLRRGDNVGAEFRFKPGHVPANKGLRLPGWGPGQMKRTQFKAGARPHTWVPVGTYRISGDGYLDLKVTDTKPSHRNWVAVHRLVWEAAHGPIPAGHIVVFRPGRRTTELAAITDDALECITRQEHARRNSIHRFPPALESAIRLAAKVRRKLDEHEQH